MQQRRKRYQTGSVVLDPRTQTWFFRWYEGKTRKAERLGNTKQYRTKAEAMRAAEGIRLRINNPEASPAVTVGQVVMRFLAEQMPERHKTSREYRSILEGKIMPAWGAKEMPLQPYDVKLWLNGLRSLKTGQALSPKTKAHVKHMLHAVHESAMLWGLIPVGRNPMSLVRVKGAGTRQKEPVILTMEEFRRLLAEVKNEPYRTMVLLAGCLGLRISEVLGLRWQDFDWLRAEVRIERGVVAGRTDDVKTPSSRKKLPLDTAIVTALKSWKSQTPFPADGDFVFASPFLLGKKPYHGYSAQYHMLRPAAKRAGLSPIGWHSLRHSYRTWLDETGAPISVQRELMRHSTIAMTMDGYGRGVASANRKANARVVGMLLDDGEQHGSERIVQ